MRKLNEKLKTIPPAAAPPPKRASEEILDEILDHAREIRRILRSTQSVFSWTLPQPNLMEMRASSSECSRAGGPSRYHRRAPSRNVFPKSGIRTKGTSSWKEASTQRTTPLLRRQIRLLSRNHEAAVYKEEVAAVYDADAFRLIRPRWARDRSVVALSTSAFQRWEDLLFAHWRLSAGCPSFARAASPCLGPLGSGGVARDHAVSADADADPRAVAATRALGVPGAEVDHKS